MCAPRSEYARLHARADKARIREDEEMVRIRMLGRDSPGDVPSSGSNAGSSAGSNDGSNAATTATTEVGGTQQPISNFTMSQSHAQQAWDSVQPERQREIERALSIGEEAIERSRRILQHERSRQEYRRRAAENERLAEDSQREEAQVGMRRPRAGGRTIDLLDSAERQRFLDLQREANLRIAIGERFDRVGGTERERLNERLRGEQRRRMDERRSPEEKRRMDQDWWGALAENGLFKEDGVGNPYMRGGEPRRSTSVSGSGSGDANPELSQDEWGRSSWDGGSELLPGSESGSASGQASVGEMMEGEWVYDEEGGFETRDEEGHEGGDEGGDTDEMGG